MWTQFSDMLQGRIDHSSVSIGNKLFVIGGFYKNEVLDSITNKFAFIKSPKLNSNRSYFVSSIKLVSIGYKIYVFRNMKDTNKEKYNRSDMLVYCYNKEQNALYQENDLNFECKVFSCAKVSKQ